MIPRFSIRLKPLFTSENVLLLRNGSSKTLIDNCKNIVNNGNNFYKSIVGMDKVEKQREKLIALKGQMITAKEKLEIADGILKKTQYDIKRVEGEISRTDRLKQYEKFAQLLRKESELKMKEKENIDTVKTSEYKRDVIQAKLDTTKSAITMLEKDHSTYQGWLRYFFLFLGIFTSAFFARDNKQILSTLDDLKKMQNNQGGYDITKLLGAVYRSTVNGLWWGCEKSYGGLKCIANVSWNASKWLAVEGADKTVKVTKSCCGYVSWVACSGYNQAKKYVYGDK